MTRPAEHALITQLLDETRTLAREVFKDSCNHTKDAVEFFHAEMGVRVHEYLAAPEMDRLTCSLEMAASLMEEAASVFGALDVNALDALPNWRWPLADELSGAALILRDMLPLHSPALAAIETTLPEPLGYVSHHTHGLSYFSRTFAEVYQDTATSIDAVYTADTVRRLIEEAEQRMREKYVKFFTDNDSLLFWGSQAAQHIKELK